MRWRCTLCRKALKTLKWGWVGADCSWVTFQWNTTQPCKFIFKRSRPTVDNMIATSYCSSHPVLASSPNRPLLAEACPRLLQTTDEYWDLQHGLPQNLTKREQTLGHGLLSWHPLDTDQAAAVGAARMSRTVFNPEATVLCTPSTSPRFSRTESQRAG